MAGKLLKSGFLGEFNWATADPKIAGFLMRNFSMAALWIWAGYFWCERELSGAAVWRAMDCPLSDKSGQNLILACDGLSALTHQRHSEEWRKLLKRQRPESNWLGPCCHVCVGS
jgi:hypothetical protein